VEGVDWINLAQVSDQRRAFVNTVKNFLVPHNAENFLNGWATVGFSRTQLLKVR
jgi:hypothetical protein